MISRFHAKLGTAGLIIAIIALIAALAGSAFAAAKLTGQQKKEVKKIAKKFAGKPGPQGPAGPTGATGPKGDPGAAGKNGASVQLGSAPGCPAGGVGLSVGSETQEVCNGENGLSELELQPGQTESGLWSFTDRGEETIQTEVEGSKSTYTTGVSGVFVTISFPLRVTPAPNFNYVPKGSSNPNCPGSFGEPKALPGELCVYADEVAGSGAMIEASGFQANKTLGRIGEVPINTGAYGYGEGSWAATAAE